MSGQTICGVAVLCFAAMAAQALELKTRGQDETEPKFMVTSGKVSGSCVEIFRAIEKTDPELHIVGDQDMVPLKRLEMMLDAKDADIACGLVHNAERDKKFVFIDPPLFQVNNVLIVRADDLVSVGSWDDVRKLGTDGLVLGNAGRGPVAKLKKMEGVLVDDSAKGTEQNLQKLMLGRGRFFYHRTPGAMSEIRQAKLEGKVKVLPVALSSDDYLMMLGRHVPAATASRLTAALNKLKASGELKAIADRWKNY